jgi:hypothetical protein
VNLYNAKILFELRPFEAWFLSYGLPIVKGNVQVSTLTFHTGTAEGKLIESYLFPELVAGVV